MIVVVVSRSCFLGEWKRKGKWEILYKRQRKISKTRRIHCMTHKVLKRCWKKIQHLVLWFLGFSPGKCPVERMKKAVQPWQTCWNLLCVCVLFFVLLSAAHVRHSINSSICIFCVWKQVNEAGYYVPVLSCVYTLYSLSNKSSTKPSMLMFFSIHFSSEEVFCHVPPVHNISQVILLSLCWLPPQVTSVEQETIWEQAWVPGVTEQVMFAHITQTQFLPADGDADVDLHNLLW